MAAQTFFNKSKCLKRAQRNFTREIFLKRLAPGQMLRAWSTLVEGDEQTYWPHCSATQSMKVMFFVSSEWTISSLDLPRDQYGCSSPATKILLLRDFALVSCTNCRQTNGRAVDTQNLLSACSSDPAAKTTHG